MASNVIKLPVAAPAYRVEFCRREARNVAAYVHKADGTRYSVQIIAEYAFCSCPDAMYRSRACKHVVMVYKELDR